eukprot:746828-Hanusia_phi.AAC.8
MQRQKTSGGRGQSDEEEEGELHEEEVEKQESNPDSKENTKSAEDAQYSSGEEEEEEEELAIFRHDSEDEAVCQLLLYLPELKNVSQEANEETSKPSKPSAEASASLESLKEEINSLREENTRVMQSFTFLLRSSPTSPLPPSLFLPSSLFAVPLSLSPQLKEENSSLKEQNDMLWSLHMEGYEPPTLLLRGKREGMTRKSKKWRMGRRIPRWSRTGRRTGRRRRRARRRRRRELDVNASWSGARPSHGLAVDARQEYDGDDMLRSEGHDRLALYITSRRWRMSSTRLVGAASKRAKQLVIAQLYLLLAVHVDGLHVHHLSSLSLVKTTGVNEN